MDPLVSISFCWTENTYKKLTAIMWKLTKLELINKNKNSVSTYGNPFSYVNTLIVVLVLSLVKVTGFSMDTLKR